MDHPATRVLAVLELLQTHGRMSGAELAQRLAVDRRTLRRYIERLEEIGIPITTDRGPHGGYQLVSGYKLPPMMFTNDEALALSLGLVAARGIGLAAGAPAVASARAKLERVMPAKIRQRARAVDETVALELYGKKKSTDDNCIATFSTAAHAGQSVCMTYRDASGKESRREFDPYGLAYRSERWYVTGYCHIREDLRSFRLDRVIEAEPLQRHFQRPVGFDVLAHLAIGVATLPRAFAIEVLLLTNLEYAQRELFATLGTLEPVGNAVLLRSQADDLDWFARELSRMPWRFEIRKPLELRGAVARHAKTLYESNSPTAADKRK
jgi:predicted DNA-binding transcriptional regulator YafY